jgi:hypothetical protein
VKNDQNGMEKRSDTKPIVVADPIGLGVENDGESTEKFKGSVTSEYEI